MISPKAFRHNVAGSVWGLGDTKTLFSWNIETRGNVRHKSHNHVNEYVMTKMRNGCGCIGKNSLCGWGSGSQGEEERTRWAMGERSREARSSRPITPVWCISRRTESLAEIKPEGDMLTGMYFRRLFRWIHGDEIGGGPEGYREEQLGSFNNRQDTMPRWSERSRNGAFFFLNYVFYLAVLSLRHYAWAFLQLQLLLLSRFSRVRLCVTP